MSGKPSQMCGYLGVLIQGPVSNNVIQMNTYRIPAAAQCPVEALEQTLIMHKKDVGMAVVLLMKGYILTEMRRVSDAKQAA